MLAGELNEKFSRVFPHSNSFQETSEECCSDVDKKTKHKLIASNFYLPLEKL
jgi:hypothetical protein